MSDDANSGRKAKDKAHDIWLAGLGAYGRAWDEAQHTLKKMEKGTSELFDELVSKGTEIEQGTEQRVREAKGYVENFSIEDRINRVRDSFGLSSQTSFDEKLDTIISDLSNLREEVRQLSQEVSQLRGSDTTDQ